jgi:hypothetical protein
VSIVKTKAAGIGNGTMATSVAFVWWEKKRLPSAWRIRASTFNSPANDERDWRATFYATGMEHSPTSATGTGWERTPVDRGR